MRTSVRDPNADVEGLRAAHEAYRRQLDEPSAKTQARATLAVARERYDRALEKIV